jgi:hypothetical protein
MVTLDTAQNGFTPSGDGDFAFEVEVRIDGGGGEEEEEEETPLSPFAPVTGT